MKQRLEAKVVVDDIIYAEGIRWHDGKVWFSDMLAFEVCAWDPGTGEKEVVARTKDRPSGLGFLPDGRLLIATMGERQLLRLDPDGLKLVVDLSGECEAMNDMVVDAKGRAYLDANAGGMNLGGGVIMVEPSGAFRHVAGDMAAPNGLAVSGDGRTLVVNDLFDNKILAFDIEADGSLSGRRVFADLGQDSPDGLCLDADGCAWVGLPFQGRCVRVREGGEITHEVVYDDRWAVAPVLGGSDRRTLYLCTAEITLEKIIELIEDPTHARRDCRGWIEAVEGVPAPGDGWP